jgi:DNA polymerase-1
MTSRPRLFLIDGHALAYRTYFALTGAGGGSRWVTNAGEPTAGVFGFTSVVLRLLEQEAPEYLAVSFDTGKTFRDDLYPEYKATRDKMPDDLRIQIDRIQQVVDAFGIPILVADGFEADDVLGTVARKAAEDGAQVFILTGDRDLFQLVDDNIIIRYSGRKLSEAEDYDPKAVRERYDLDPHQLIDLKAMMGDSSDNIPGVKGVGEKTATKLLKQYGDLETIYEHLEDIEARFSNKLKAHKDDAFLSRKLGRIVTDVPLEFELEACRAKEYDRDQIVEIFRQLEFRSLLNRIDAVDQSQTGQQMSLFVSTEGETAPISEEVITVDSESKLEALTKALETAKQIAFDVETTSTDAITAELVGISLAVEPGSGYYIPIGHLPMHAGGPQLPIEQVIEAIKEPMTDPSIPKVGHNLKYDFLVLVRYGLRPDPLDFDTMLAEWLINPASRNLGLKSLAWVRLGLEMTTIDALIGSGRSQRSMAEVPIGDVAPYAVADAEVCLRLKPLLEEELDDRDQHKLFNEIEMPLISILADMEMAGIMLDADYLRALSQEMGKALASIEEDIYSHAGHQFNINSTQQLSQVLFTELGLEPPDNTRKTKSGHYSTAAGVLEELTGAHPIVGLVLEHRELSKLQSTYTEALLRQVNPATGRVHTSYSQTGSVTGRLASSDPNLQNIPIRSELGRRIRGAFVAREGWSLLGVDYSQIELRIVAHIAQDKAMIKAFKDDQDIHATTAAAIFEVEQGDVTANMRRRAKAINFGLLYGMSPFGLTRTTDLTLAEAEDFVDAYFKRFPGIERYLEETRQMAKEHGYVETLLGRRRYFPELAEGARVSEIVRSRALREAINAPIQGSAADIIKIAMLDMPKAIQNAGLKAQMLLQVHDELVFEVPQDELEATSEIVEKVMGAAYKLSVPLKTDAKAGENWAEMKPLS